MTSPASVGGDGPLRLFLALRLGDDDRAALAAWGEAVCAEAVRAAVGRSDGDAEWRVRPVPAAQLHVTLAFLGHRPRSDVAPAVAALRAAATGAGPLALRPVRWRTTRSVGMLVLDDEGGRAAALAGRVHDGLEALGIYRRERRPWLPHVTVCRFRAWPGGEVPSPPGRTCVPSDAAAYVSLLHPDGPRYEVLQAVPITNITYAMSINGMDAHDDRTRGKEQA